MSRAAGTGAEGKTSPAERRRRCPICGRPAVARFAPFCSRRCADVDLARWLGGHYVLPGEEPAPRGEEAEEG